MNSKDQTTQAIIEALDTLGTHGEITFRPDGDSIVVTLRRKHGAGTIGIDQRIGAPELTVAQVNIVANVISRAVRKMTELGQ